MTLINKISPLLLLPLIFILSSCSLGVVSRGGDKSYVYDHRREYSQEELKELSSSVIETLERDPLVGEGKSLFKPGLLPIKRVGMVVFESEIQPTLGGLSGKNLIYLSSSGKQILTENFLSLWEESFEPLLPEYSFLSSKIVGQGKFFHQYGSPVTDYVNSSRSTLAPDDIFYLESGKNTTSVTLLNPRGMRDLSLLLIPALELSGGPKWSEHAKHFYNDVSKELNLDATLGVISYISWSAAHVDKHSGKVIPEELQLHLKASILVPLNQYHKRLEKLRLKERPGVTVCFKKYEGKISLPIQISQSESDKNFETISSELLQPLMKSYKDLTHMMLLRLREDLLSTW